MDDPTPSPSARLTPTRRSFLQASGALALSPAALAAKRRGAETRGPNVLWIISDQHRPDVAGFAGNRLAKTPFLDQFARQAATLAETYCQIPLCVPARQSLLTAQLPHAHGSFRNWEYFPEPQETLPKRFQAAGYETALIGKSHCNVDGFERVVEHSERFVELRAEEPELRMPGSHFYRADDCPYPNQLAQMNPRCVTPNEGPKFYMEAVVRDDALAFLAEQRERPFFLWASFLNPHPPLFPPPEYIELFRDVDLPSEAPATDQEFAALFAADKAHYRRSEFASLTQEDLRGITRAYYAAVTWMDACVGALIAGLDKLGLAQNTIVVYTSDHGEMLGEHGLLQKGTFFEGAARVPALIRYPQRVKAGVVQHVFNHVDLSRSVLELAGLEAPEDTSARSCTRLLAGEDTAWEDTAYAELIKGGALNGVKLRMPYRRSKLQQMVRLENLKYVRHNKYEQALFDLSEDPRERVNLLEDKKFADALGELKQRAERSAPDAFRVLGSGGR